MGISSHPRARSLSGMSGCLTWHRLVCYSMCVCAFTSFCVHFQTTEHANLTRDCKSRCCNIVAVHLLQLLWRNCCRAIVSGDMVTLATQTKVSLWFALHDKDQRTRVVGAGASAQRPGATVLWHAGGLPSPGPPPSVKKSNDSKCWPIEHIV